VNGALYVGSNPHNTGDGSIDWLLLSGPPDGGDVTVGLASAVREAASEEGTAPIIAGSPTITASANHLTEWHASERDLPRTAHSAGGLLVTMHQRRDT